MNLNEFDASTDDKQSVMVPMIQSDSFAIATGLRTYIKPWIKEQKRSCKPKIPSLSIEDEGLSNAEDLTAHKSNEGLTVSYAEASERILDDLYNHLAWMVTDTGELPGLKGRVPLIECDRDKNVNFSPLAITNSSMPQYVGLAF